MNADNILQQHILDNPDALRENQLQQKDQFILDADDDEDRAKKNDLMRDGIPPGQMRPDFELTDDIIVNQMSNNNNDVGDDEVKSNADTEKRGPQNQSAQR